MAIINIEIFNTEKVENKILLKNSTDSIYRRAQNYK